MTTALYSGLEVQLLIGQWRNEGFTDPEIALSKIPSLKLPLELQRAAIDSLTERPEIICTDRELRDQIADALDALYKANKPESIFRRSGQLARILLDEKATPFIETLSESALRGKLARTCNFVRVMPKSGNKPISPPLDITRDILALGEWDFPPLLGLVESPVVRPDGTILTKAGYDQQTSLYYQPSADLNLPAIPESPTDDQLKEAINLVSEIFINFPFDSEASRANALGTLFTPIVRPMITGPIPFALFDKPQAGTGATLAASIIGRIATGRDAAMMVPQGDEESWRKCITSILIRGQLLVVVDNIENTLWAASLAALLTATVYQDRILGRSEMVTLPNKTTWLGTGNNIMLSGSIPRRCLWIRMDAGIANPKCYGELLGCCSPQPSPFYAS